jgi:hypothetical protein
MEVYPFRREKGLAASQRSLCIQRHADSFPHRAFARMHEPLRHRLISIGSARAWPHSTSGSISRVHFADSTIFCADERTAREYLNSIQHYSAGAESRHSGSSFTLQQRRSRTARHAGRPSGERSGGCAGSLTFLYAPTDCWAALLRPCLEHSMLIDQAFRHQSWTYARLN